MLPHTVTYRSGQLEPEGIHLMRKSRENEPCPSWCLGSSVEAQSLAFPGKFLSPGCQSDLECLLLGFSHLLFLLFFESFALVIPLSFFFSFFLKKKKILGERESWSALSACRELLSPSAAASAFRLLWT